MVGRGTTEGNEYGKLMQMNDSIGENSLMSYESMPTSMVSKPAAGGLKLIKPEETSSIGYIPTIGSRVPRRQLRPAPGGPTSNLSQGGLGPSPKAASSYSIPPFGAKQPSVGNTGNQIRQPQFGGGGGDNQSKPPGSNIMSMKLG